MSSKLVQQKAPLSLPSWEAVRSVCLAALPLAAVLVLAAPAWSSESTQAPSPRDMVRIPAGVYRPLYGAPAQRKVVAVPAYWLDRLPVTVGQYLEFVRANPSWRRSQVSACFADLWYLRNWATDLDPGRDCPLDTPVTFVSWFAAQAYAQWQGKRLPTVAEWEHAAAASTTRADGENDPAFRREVLRWYTTLGSALRPVGQGQPNLWGVHDLHGLVWEWAQDFNATSTVADSEAGKGGKEQDVFCGSAAQGASDTSNYPAFMRFGFRSSLSASYCVHNLGFRCARTLD